MYSSFSHSYLSPSLGGFGIGAISLIVLIIIIALKGLALWTAAKRDEKWWFIAMLVINTAGILEFVYLLFFAKFKFDQFFTKSTNTPSTPAAN